MKKVGVIGQKGFLGSHLITELDRQKIIYSTFPGNLLNTEDIQSYFDASKIDTAIFLVGGHFPPINSLIEKNVTTLSNFLEIGTKNGLKKIIYASSGAVYGNANHPSLESDKLLPNTSYGLTKKIAEEVIEYYKYKSNLQSIILRFTSVYGYGNKTGVIYQFWKSITENQFINIEGDGTQIRDFLHISDAIKAIQLSIAFNNSDVFNITAQTQTSINDLSKLFKQKYKFRIKHSHSNNNLAKMTLNPLKASKLLHFKANITNIIIP